MCSLCPCWRPNLYLRCLRFNLTNLWPHRSKEQESTDFPFFLSQSPLSAVRPEACVGMEVSSVSGESDRNDESEEEILPFLLHPLQDKHQHVEKDFRNLIDWWVMRLSDVWICRNKQLYMSSLISCCVFIPSYQSFKALPGRLDTTVTLKSHDLLDFGDTASLWNTSVMDRQQHRVVNEKEMTKSAQQWVMSLFHISFTNV